jgi:DNA-binding transcriptional LysR family regulator
MWGSTGFNSHLTKLCSVRFVPCASPKYLEKWGVPREPEDLWRHQCLRNVISTKNSLSHFSGPNGLVSVQVSGALAANTNLPLGEAALRGLDIGLFPQFNVRDNLRCGALVQVLNGFGVSEMPLFAIYPNRNLTAKLRVFVDFLAESFSSGLIDAIMTELGRQSI